MNPKHTRKATGAFFGPGCNRGIASCGRVAVTPVKIVNTTIVGAHRATEWDAS